MIRNLFCLAPALLMVATSACARDVSDLSGRWTQSSSGQELVLQSKIKLQPNVSGGFGTSLGGSVGFGSMTKTTVVTEAVPAHVERRMTLELAADGGFTWTIVRTEPVDADCTRTVRQEKHGKATLADGALVFDIASGTESFEKSCGGTGETVLSPGREAYTLTLDGGRMTLAGGASKWVFARP